MKRILITGGSGAIGGQLARKLSQDFDVLVLDDLSSGNVENLRDLPVKLVRGSVVDDEILREVFEWKPEIVYHLAGLISIQPNAWPALERVNVNAQTSSVCGARRRAAVYLYVIILCIW